MIRSQVQIDHDRSDTQLISSRRGLGLQKQSKTNEIEEGNVKIKQCNHTYQEHS